MNEPENDHQGCDLRTRCGFYCDFAQRKSAVWQSMIRNYCEGTNFSLCARRIFFTRTGNCAPVDMTPIGTLPKELFDDLLRQD
ncbi:MAG: hypothetical protein IH614_11020 [Desulfuromonadales bacterium]|nr:hypothetical protein [Desulfuromonadales bacterium]